MKNDADQASITAKAGCILTGALALAIGISAIAAEPEDHVVQIREAQTLKQVVERELQSAQFAEQIATYNGIATVTTILPIGASLQIPKPYLLDRQFGQVAFVKGDVVHSQTSLVVNPPAKGARVFAGDTFSTGDDGFVSLIFNSGATVNVQPDSTVAVANIDCINDTVKCVIALEATAGEIQSEVTPRAEGLPPVEFSVNTPFLSAAVRGTAFYVSVDEGADRLGVTHGLVAADAGGVANDLPKGKGLSADGSAPVVVDLLSAPVINTQAQADLISQEDFIEWNTIAGAERYRYVIATDEGLAQPVAQGFVPRAQTSPRLPEPGKYFFSVAGVDNQEFIGLPVITEFTYVAIEEGDSLELEIQRLGDSMSLTSIDYVGQVELTIGNDINSPPVSRRFIDDMSAGITLELDPAKDWVFQARKIIDETTVSRYGNQYLLESIE